MVKKQMKEWKEIEDKFGITVWEEIRDFISKLYLKIDELTKSRESWRKKYFELKNGKKN